MTVEQDQEPSDLQAMLAEQRRRNEEFAERQRQRLEDAEQADAERQAENAELEQDMVDTLAQQRRDSAEFEQRQDELLSAAWSRVDSE